MSKANVFATHPAGFRIHFEVDDSRIPEKDEGGVTLTSGEVVNRMLVNLGILTQWMVNQHYTAEYAAQAPQAAPAGSTTATEPSNNPPCDQCGGATEYKEGKSKKTGALWRGYFCLKTKGAPQASQHVPIWID